MWWLYTLIGYFCLGLVVLLLDARSRSQVFGPRQHDEDSRAFPPWKFVLYRLCLGAIVLVWPILILDWLRISPPSTRRKQASRSSEPLQDYPNFNNPICLQKKITAEQAEAAHLVTDERLGCTPVPFGFSNHQWRSFLEQLQPGDELWEFSSSPESWRHRCGRSGIALVRHNRVIASMVTRMN